MIEKIIPNKKQAKILVLMLVSPQRAFFVGEIKKHVGGAGLEQAISALLKSNYLITFKKRGNRYLMVNSEHGFFDQLRAAAFKSLKRRTDDDLIKLFKRLKGVKAVILSGLFMGDTKGDCDMVLVGNFSERQLSNFVGKIEDLIGQEINYAIFEPSEYNYRKNIFDRFMKNIFENKHLVLMDKTK